MTPLLLHNISKHVGKATKEVVINVKTEKKEVETKGFAVNVIELPRQMAPLFTASVVELKGILTTAETVKQPVASLATTV